MSEKIYALLLRFYPDRFREAYGEAALQLFRDRYRDEPGFLSKLRLWFDLLCDLLISIPREYRHVQPALAAASVKQQEDGTPGFLVLEGKPPRPEALFFGSLLSLAAIGAFAIAIGHAGSYRPFRAFVAPSPSSPHLRPTASGNSAAQSHDDGDEEFIGTGEQTTASPPLPAEVLKQAQTQDAVKPSTTITAGGAEIDAIERRRVIDAAVANLKQHYFDPEVAQKMAEALLSHAKDGDDNTAKTGAGFAVLLTKQMRDISHDMHLVVVHSQTVLPSRAMAARADQLSRYRTAMEKSNCTIETVEVLQHNIGYLKLNSFPDPSVCRAKISTAMASLNSADAVIFDLRDNSGGFPDAVAMFAGYLFDHPEHLYSPRDVPAEQSWTHSPIAGNRLADKPVYVLTSGSTISAAEAFSYNLKMMRRATIVGETTQGSAHAGVFHRMDDHFGIGIPEVKVVNPFGKTDWEGVGVEPDVKVKATDALATAERLAENKLKR